MKDGDLPDGLDVEMLRTLFRGLPHWRVLVEDYGFDYEIIVDSDGDERHIADIQHLLDVSQEHLPTRQAQAIKLFLVEGLRECDVASLMGIAHTNPIGMYATDGLRRLIEMVQSRRLPR